MKTLALVCLLFLSSTANATLVCIKHEESEGQHIFTNLCSEATKLTMQCGSVSASIMLEEGEVRRISCPGLDFSWH